MEPDDDQAQARVRENVRAQEIVRTEMLAREEVRAAFRAELTLRHRMAIAAAMLVTFVIGILIGAYGLRPAENRALVGVMPPERWGREAELDRVGDAALGSGQPALGLAATPTAWPLSVYVSGAVARARIVRVPPGSLVADVLEAAGGSTADADLDALNLAAPVSDNQHVLVPTLRAPVMPDSRAGSGSPLGTGQPPIDINKASASDLERLPDIGATRAEAIVAYREAHGPFDRVDDILAVPGIGPVIYERIAPLITVGP
ncbi:MAG: helix-hairpin-helix domain-containing protein [Anaerolineae bacterium]|nr:helix-hairpin-helix domain-containing protein [Anaerolineae bacterium]